MQKIKVAIKVLNSNSKLETILIRIVNDPTPNISHEKHLEPLIEWFRHNDLTENGENVCKVFNSYLSGCKSWTPALKLLYASHELINSVGKGFCGSFLYEYFENIHDLMKSKSEVESYVNGVLAANYYNFLIIYAKYFADIKLHSGRNPKELLNLLQTNNFTQLVQLATFRNIVKYYIKVNDAIQGSLNVTKNCSLTNKISNVLLRDVVAVYNLISRNLQVIIPHIFEFDADIVLLLDEIYSDFILLTKKIRDIIEKANENGVYNTPDVNYYIFDEEFNRQEELFVLDIKKSRPKNDTNRSYHEYMQSYQTLNPGKKLYKLNTRANTLTNFPSSQPKQSEPYFNIASPEASELEDESFIPMRKGEDNDFLSQQINVLPANLIETGSQKDIQPTKTDIGIPRFKSTPIQDNDYEGLPRNYRLKYDGNDLSDLHGKRSPGSVMFTPKTFVTNNFIEEDNLFDIDSGEKPKNNNIFLDEDKRHDFSPDQKKFSHS